MALLVECPQCRRCNSQKEKACNDCGFLLAKHSGRIWGYYIKKSLEARTTFKALAQW
jgi:hypothetical protein